MRAANGIGMIVRLNRKFPHPYTAMTRLFVVAFLAIAAQAPAQQAPIDISTARSYFDEARPP